MPSKERMNIVIVGHVDHGKSTLIGRLLADTNSLPKGKLEDVKRMCEKNSKPFEYAFLLDALKDERSQGITIDTARCFFQTEKRYYIIIDAPGHIEFLKNMISGAARAEAAILIIDAHDGIQENSRRHGFLLSILGISQVLVVINKMDLIGYDEQRYYAIRDEYGAFLKKIGVTPQAFVPISAFQGDAIIGPSENMPWYTGTSILNHIDTFEKQAPDIAKPLRLPVQDVYKFTAQQDRRRILAGTIQTGKVTVGDSIICYPSKKESKIASIERFSAPKTKTAQCGEAIGLTLTTQVYLKPGEILCQKHEQPPHITTKFRVHLFWMAHQPMRKGKSYSLKLATSRVSVIIDEIVHVFDTQELNLIPNPAEIKRHDVAECILRSTKPLAFDTSDICMTTSRFVIIDAYEITGGGTIQEALYDPVDAEMAELLTITKHFSYSKIDASAHTKRFGHEATLILLQGDRARDMLEHIEREFYEQGFMCTGIELHFTESIHSPEGQTYLSHLQVATKTALRAGLICICASERDDPDEFAFLANVSNACIVYCSSKKIAKSQYSCSAPDQVKALINRLKEDGRIVLHRAFKQRI